MTYILNYQNGTTTLLDNAENYCASGGVCPEAEGNHILNSSECPEGNTLHSTLSYMSGETEVMYMSCCIPNSVA